MEPSSTESRNKMNHRVYVNRTLNLKKIQYMGFDMDHTLIRYKSHNFEGLAHQKILKKLVDQRGYPKEILSLPFEYDRVIRGLVIDRRMGNLLKLNRYAGIRVSYHGTKPIDFSEQKKLYKSIYIDLSDTNYAAIDTSFSIALALLFSQLVDLKTESLKDRLPSYEIISRDVEECLDEAHRDGSLKETVSQNLDHYVHRDPDLVKALERYKKHGKKLFVLTNSEYSYTKNLLDYAITPFLKSHKSWVDLFEIVITSAQKPRFFWDQLHFLKINPQTGTMTAVEGNEKTGVFYGGCASKFTKMLGVGGEDILYVGDHIYGDIVRLKKDCNWRTALVVEELHNEIEKIRETRPLNEQISALMKQKEPYELEALNLHSQLIDDGRSTEDERLTELHKKISTIDQQIGLCIQKQSSVFNSYWGEIMRVGNEESFFAYQLERYACIYMSELKDLMSYSPRTYFRAFRRGLPHEVGDSKV